VEGAQQRQTITKSAKGRTAAVKLNFGFNPYLFVKTAGKRIITIIYYIALYSKSGQSVKELLLKRAA
jgi:hypothetical protein